MYFLVHFLNQIATYKIIISKIISNYFKLCLLVMNCTGLSKMNFIIQLYFETKENKLFFAVKITDITFKTEEI